MTKVRARSDAGCVAKLFVPHAWAVATRCLTAPTIEYPTTHIKYFEDLMLAYGPGTHRAALGGVH